MPVEVMTEAPGWQASGVDVEALATRAADATLCHLGHDPALFEVSLLAADDARLRALNAQFRAQDKPTNVLSWPAEDLAPEHPGALPFPPEPGTPDDPLPLGDIALALETCRREAEAARTPLPDHLAHLIVHGLLHLLGYDHETEADALLMEATETAILETMGITDPYAGFSEAPVDDGTRADPTFGKDR